MKISIFGNPDLPSDALPIKILPELKRLFPKINFIIEDPNELNLPSKDWLIIDTVENIKSVKVINLDRVEKIKKSSASLHDFDLGMHLLWIQKIQKNVNIKIIETTASNVLMNPFSFIFLLMKLLKSFYHTLK